MRFVKYITGEFSSPVGGISQSRRLPTADYRGLPALVEEISESRHYPFFAGEVSNLTLGKS